MPDRVSRKETEMTLAKNQELRDVGLFQASEESAVLPTMYARPPVLVLAQSNNSDKYPNTGELYRIDTLESFEELRVIPFLVQSMRSKLPEGPYHRDRRPECVSLDYIRPVATLPFSGEPSLWYAMDAKKIEGLTGGAVSKAEDIKCATCPYAAADPYRTPRDQGYCFPEFMAFLMEIGTGEGYIINLRSTSAGVAPILGSKRVYRKRAVTLTSVKVDSSKGTYYKLIARPDQEDAPEEDQELARAMVDLFNVEEVAGAEYEDQSGVASDQEGGEKEEELPF